MLKRQSQSTLSVASLISHGPVAIDKAIEITIAACEAYAPRRRRDFITPEQILIGEDGRVTFLPVRASLGDHLSGIVQALRLRTKSLALRRGKPKVIVVRNVIEWDLMEVFELGATLWAMLAGRPLTSSEWVGDKVRSPPNVPSALEAIIHSALTPKLDERYRTLRELSAALTAYRAGNHGP